MNNSLTLKSTSPVLVAHRGYSGRYPENTLLSYQAAYQHGARFMELDLQMTSDQVPVLHHDANLKRMSGVDVDIRDVKASMLKRLNASYPERFADEFKDTRFTKFKKLCKWLAKHPDVTMFVELKQETIDRFGTPVFVDEVYRRALATEAARQCVFISFNPEIVEYTRSISPLQTGWVLPEWNDKNRAILQKLKPDFLFISKDILPANDDEIWRGSWQLAVYNLDDADSAIAMANRNIPYLETNQIGKLMENNQLAGRD